MTQKELPNGWESGIGERNSDQQYTKFFYKPSENLEIRVYSDPNEPHTALLRNTEKDRIIGSEKEETEEEATESAYDMMQDY